MFDLFVCVFVPLCSVIDSADPPPFKEQLELFANHGIFVTPHGPALTNMMFMVPFTGVVGACPPPFLLHVHM